MDLIDGMQEPVASMNGMVQASSTACTIRTPATALATKALSLKAGAAHAAAERDSQQQQPGSVGSAVATRPSSKTASSALVVAAVSARVGHACTEPGMLRGRIDHLQPPPAVMLALPGGPKPAG